MKGGIYGPAMHVFIIDELELGTKAATAIDDEACGLGPLFDVIFDQHMEAER